MKLRSMMVAALAVATMASCSKDANNGESNGSDNNEPTYASITLKIADSNAPGTRANNNLASTPAEGAVKNVRLYMADASGVILDQILFVGTSTQSVLTTVGPKQFFAVVNIPTANLPVVTATTTLTDVMDHINTISGMGDMTDITNGYWMTSTSVHSVHLVVADAASVSADPTHPNNLQLDVARMMAKIGVYFDDNSGAGVATTDGDGVVTSMDYRIDNILNKNYILGGLDAGGHYRTPGYDASLVTLTNYFNQASYSGTGLTLVNIHAAPTYMSENNNLIPRYGNTTYALLKAKFEPEATMLYSATDGTSAGSLPLNGTFWRIANVTMNGSRPTIDSWEPDFYDGDPSALSIFDGTTQIAYEYVDGYCYYALYLNNPSGRTAYSIERNQYWDATIKSIKGVGYPRENNEDGDHEGPQDPDPDKPIKTDVYIDATITVLGWVGVDMDGDLVGTEG